MLEAFLEALPIAIGTVLATLPLISVSLLLVSRPDRGAPFAFLAGWAVAAIGIGGVAMFLSDVSTPGQHPPAVWVVWLRLGLGAGLIALALRKWLRRKTASGADEVPGWMRALESISVLGAFALGAGLLVLNPKNALLITSGALVIASVTYAPVEQAAALLGFATVASLGLAAPLTIAVMFGPRADQPLQAMTSFMQRHSATIVSAVLLVLGLVVVSNALSDL